MTPGAYLQKRRAIAGYSIDSLERELALIDGFARRAYDDSRRRQLRLIDAEADTHPLSLEEAQLIASILAVDPMVYRQLVDFHENRSADYPRLCVNCGASDTTMGRQPFSGIPGRAAQWEQPGLCNLCAAAISPGPGLDPFDDAPPGYASVVIVDDCASNRRAALPDGVSRKSLLRRL